MRLIPTALALLLASLAGHADLFAAPHPDAHADRRASTTQGVQTQGRCSFNPGASEGGAVRSEEPAIRRLVDIGIACSPTFRRLVTELASTDVVVHVFLARRHNGLRGYLVHRVVEAGGVRFLQIAIDAGGAEPRVIGLLAHELQHALEVARVPEVGRTRRIDRFFEEIADNVCRSATCSETRAATEVQEAVVDELD